MSHIIKIEKFEGPLDLLLQLIESQELDISDISLAQVTDQYVEYINNTDLDPSEIADFLNIAARLLLLKSRLLLPFVNTNEEEDALDLANQLRVYSNFAEAAKVINGLWKNNKTMYTRDRLVYKTDGFNPPANVTKEILPLVYRKVVSKIKPFLQLPKKTMIKVISLKEKIDYLVGLIKTKTKLHFNEILGKKNDSSEKIVSFLAVLELVKQKQINVEQTETFSAILIKKIDV